MRNPFRKRRSVYETGDNVRVKPPPKDPRWMSIADLDDFVKLAPKPDDDTIPTRRDFKHE